MKKAAYYIVLVLLIIVCGATAYGAYYYYDNFKDANNEYEDLIIQKGNLVKELADPKATEEDEESEEEEAEDEGEEALVDTSDWVTYTNEKYGFSFKHPADYTTDGCPSKPCSDYVGDLTDGDNTVMQGDISEVGWPNISVMHMSSDFYNPPADTDLREWIVASFSYYDEYLSLSPNYTITTSGGDSIQAYDFTVPSSPQSYSQRYIYFIDDEDQLFTIQLYDYETYSQAFYNAWLDTFIY